MPHRPRVPLAVSTLVHVSVIGVLWSASTTLWRDRSSVLELEGRVSAPDPVPLPEPEPGEAPGEALAVLLDPPPPTPLPVLEEDWLPERTPVAEAAFRRPLDLVMEARPPSPVPVKPGPPIPEPEPPAVEVVPATTVDVEEDRASTDPERPDPRAPLYAPHPPYPPRALRLGLEGRVVLLVQVDPDGQVHDCLVLESSGYLLLDASARRCLMTWRFPALPAEAEVRFVRVPIRFRRET